MAPRKGKKEKTEEVQVSLGPQVSDRQARSRLGILIISFDAPKNIARQKKDGKPQVF